MEKKINCLLSWIESKEYKNKINYSKGGFNNKNIKKNKYENFEL